VSILWITVALIALQRLAVLAYSIRNSRRLIDRGGVEVGALQFPLIMLLQAAWLASMVAFIAPATPPNWWALGIVILLQPVRIWIIGSLGESWSTRVITVPGSPLVRSGLYRFVRHPNYVAVAAEIALVPLAFGSYTIAAIFFAAYVGLVWWRIHDENRALASRPG
jgi:methyltransferase